MEEFDLWRKKMKTNLQRLRKEAGWKSARLFAEHLGLNVRTYTDYEQGKITMPITKAWDIADELECTLDELLGREFHPDDSDQKKEKPSV